jgi:hypothetical protein
VRSVPVNRRELLLAALGQPVIAIPSHAQQETPRDRAPSSDAIRSLLALRVDAGRESLDHMFAGRGDPPHSMQVTRVGSDGPNQCLMHRETGHAEAYHTRGT